MTSFPPIPVPLETSAAQFDDLFPRACQRAGVRHSLAVEPYTPKLPLAAADLAEVVRLYRLRNSEVEDSRSSINELVSSGSQESVTRSPVASTRVSAS